MQNGEERAHTRVSFDELRASLAGILAAHGFTDERAALCARLFAEASLDGVASHGLNRFPRFMEMIRLGVIDIGASPVRVRAVGGLERWDGRNGPGNLNAHASMGRAIELSRTHGVACVALSNTNHWMRGGSYGWQAAAAGVIGLCWTNTLANLPPWGGTEPRIGNNPLVIAVPRPGGPVVLDMAMSQFSFGALESYRRRGELLPVAGGYDAAGTLTRDAAAIEGSRRPLPIGYWKGSGLSILLDVVAAALSGGLATHEISTDPLRESGLSQVFIAFDPASAGGQGWTEVVDRIVADLHAADDSVRYPGERTRDTRERNLREGVPVDPEVWAAVRRLLAGGS